MRVFCVLQLKPILKKTYECLKCRLASLEIFLKITQSGAISTDHSVSELKVIWTNAHRVDPFFSTLPCLPNLNLLCSPVKH